MQPTNVVLHAHAGSARFDAQVGVYLVYATAAGHGMIDRELSLPRSWRKTSTAAVPHIIGGSRVRAWEAVPSRPGPQGLFWSVGTGPGIRALSPR